jgi:molybdate transport system substrate-binding protein
VLVAVALVAVALLAASCRPESHAGRPQVTIGAAANLTEIAPVLGSEFEGQTGIHPTFSFASTAQLASQIENGAPFDVYLAADAAHVDGLDRKSLLVSGSSAIYVNGILALWVPSKTDTIRRVEDLTRPEVRVIAMAKPELAPYGEAALEALRHAGVWNAVESKIVYAENVNAAKQYGTSRNADAVFVAYSLVLKESGAVIQVAESEHQPIAQKLGILRASGHIPEAREFVEFVLHGKGRDIFESHGYRPPALVAK